MRVDEATLKRIADVARIRLSEGEAKELLKQMNEIIGSFSKISGVDTKGVHPSFQPVELRNALREDKIKPGLSQKEALSNSKLTKEGYFRGPRSV